MCLNMQDIYDKLENDENSSGQGPDVLGANDACKRLKGNDNTSQIQNETNVGNDKLDQSATSGNENTGTLEQDNKLRENSDGAVPSKTTNGNDQNETARNIADESKKQATQQASQQIAEEGAEKVAEKAGETVAKEAVKEVAKEAGKKAAVEAVSDAAAAPTAGASKVVQFALDAITFLGREIKNLDPHTSNENGGLLTLVLIAMGIFLLTCTYLQKLVPGSMSNHQLTSFSKNLTDRGMEEEGVGKIEREFADSDLAEYGGNEFLKPGFDDYIYGILDSNGKRDTKTGIRNALHDAINEECFNIVKNLGSKSLRKFINNYDEEKSFKTFYDNPFPYDLQTNTVSSAPNFPRIGDVMKRNLKGKEYTEDYIEYAPHYNDVNYAEMLSVFTCNPIYNWEECDYEDFNEYIRTQRAKNLYYEMKVTWVVVYKGTTSTTDSEGNVVEKTENAEKEFPTEEEACNSPDSVVVNGITCTRDSYYCNVKVKPFGLRELYLMAEVSPYDIHEDYYRHTNYEMLDSHEEYSRTYMRDNADEMGPSYREDRSVFSSIYTELIQSYGEAKGRSAWCYISDAETYNLQDLGDICFDPTDGHVSLTLDDLDIDTSNMTSQQIALLEYLVSAVGCKYSQDNRWGTGMYDCSSLVVRAYRSIGISITGTGTTGLAGDWNGGTNTGSIYGWGVANNKISNTLKVGSILVYNDGGTANHAGISHVGIYIGDGKMIDARGKAYGVVQRDMRKSNLYAIINPM